MVIFVFRGKPKVKHPDLIRDIQDATERENQRQSAIEKTAVEISSWLDYHRTSLPELAGVSAYAHNGRSVRLIRVADLSEFYLELYDVNFALYRAVDDARVRSWTWPENLKGDHAKLIFATQTILDVISTVKTCGTKPQTS
jgi:hypothetical protein